MKAETHSGSRRCERKLFMGSGGARNHVWFRVLVRACWTEPTETRSLPLLSIEYATGSIAAENGSSRPSHAEEQANRALRWLVTIMKAGKSKPLTVHLRRLTPHLTRAVRRQLPAAPAARASCPQHLVIEMFAMP